MPDDSTAVVFRRWRDTGTVIALFPEIPTDINGYFCEAYEHVGQHGGADYYGVIKATSHADLQDVASMKKELEVIGYKLKPIKRASRQVHEARMSAARAAL